MPGWQQLIWQLAGVFSTHFGICHYREIWKHRQGGSRRGMWGPSGLIWSLWLCWTMRGFARLCEAMCQAIGMGIGRQARSGNKRSGT